MDIHQQRQDALPGIFLALGLLASVAGCEGKLASLADEVLQDRVYECGQARDQSPAFAIRCDNYRRECERRRDQGHFVC